MIITDDTKTLNRVISFVKSLGGLYADIADDAQKELDRLVAEIEMYKSELLNTGENND